MRLKKIMPTIYERSQRSKMAALEIRNSKWQALILLTNVLYPLSTKYTSIFYIPNCV